MSYKLWWLSSQMSNRHHYFGWWPFLGDTNLRWHGWWSHAFLSARANMWHANGGSFTWDMVTFLPWGFLGPGTWQHTTTRDARAGRLLIPSASSTAATALPHAASTAWLDVALRRRLTQNQLQKRLGAWPRMGHARGMRDATTMVMVTMMSSRTRQSNEWRWHLLV
jgi:hypothetical protein